MRKQRNVVDWLRNNSVVWTGEEGNRFRILDRDNVQEASKERVISSRMSRIPDAEQHICLYISKALQPKRFKDSTKYQKTKEAALVDLHDQRQLTFGQHVECQGQFLDLHSPDSNRKRRWHERVGQEGLG